MIVLTGEDNPRALVTKHIDYYYDKIQSKEGRYLIPGWMDWNAVAVGAEHFFHFGAKMIDNTTGTFNCNITLTGHFVVDMKDLV